CVSIVFFCVAVSVVCVCVCVCVCFPTESAGAFFVSVCVCVCVCVWRCVGACVVVGFGGVWVCVCVCGCQYVCMFCVFKTDVSLASYTPNGTEGPITALSIIFLFLRGYNGPKVSLQ